MTVNIHFLTDNKRPKSFDSNSSRDFLITLISTYGKMKGRMALSNFELGTWAFGRVDVYDAAIVSTVTVILLYWISRLTSPRWYRSRSKNLPPGPRGWPLVGALPYVGQFPHRSFLEMSQKYGPIMYMRIGPVPVMVISNAEMAKAVLHTNDLLFASKPSLIVPTTLTYGQQDIVFAPYGPQWRQSRKIATQKLLTQSKLAHFMGHLKEEILITIHTALEQSQTSYKDGVPVNISALLNGMAMNIITKMMWNKKHRNIKGKQTHRDKEFQELIKAVMSVAGANNIADFLPCFQSLTMKLSGLQRRVIDIRDAFDRFCETIIQEKEQALARSPDSKAVEDDDDFVDVLLKLKNQPGDYQGLSRESMKAMMSDMIVAGTDSSSVTLEWIIAELMRHPHILKKAQDELTAVVGEDRLVSETDIPNLKYLDAVVKEALRVHLPIPMGLHYSMADSKVGGYDVPEKTVTFVNLYAIQRDPNQWEKPWDFNPDRFLQSQQDYRGHNYEFIPFGSGRRICAGLNHASTLIHIALAHLLHTVNWSLPEGQAPEDVDMSECSGVSLCRSTPLFVMAKARLPHHVIFPRVA